MADYPDPFLLSHIVLPGIIHLGGRVSPGSIRDQALRALIAVERLRAQKYFLKGDRILVVGGGVAGVYAALATAEAGAEVVVVDKNSDVLALQRKNHVRIVSPTFYDWPAKHWIDREFNGWPLKYPEASCVEAVQQWSRIFHAKKKSGALAFKNETECVGIQDSGANRPPWTALLKGIHDAHPRTEGPFQLIFLCNSAAGELEGGIAWDNGTKPEFPIFPFWEPDPLPAVYAAPQQPPLTPQPVDPPAFGEAAQVVIIGGGDGGLQDLLRVVSGGKSARDMLDAIQPWMEPDEMASLYHLLDSEHCRLRHHAGWLPMHDQDLLGGWQVEYQDALHRIYHGPDTRQQQLRQAIKDLVVFDDVLLFHQHAQLGRCYGANRLLASLVDQHMMENGKHGSIFRFERVAKRISCRHNQDPDHATNSEAFSHFTGQHVITFEHSTGKFTETVHARSVIVRSGRPPVAKGADQKQSELDKARDKSYREFLPFWLPYWHPASKAPAAVRFSGPSSLRTEQACRAALWRCSVAALVVKDNDGKVFSYNPRFSSVCPEAPASIIGHYATDYWKQSEAAQQIVEWDADVRKTGKPVLTREMLNRAEYFTIRFALPMNNGGPGTGSLGLSLLDGSVEHDGRSSHLSHEPSREEIHRFFDYLPFSVAITDERHRYVYANPAFQRVAAPAGVPTVRAVDILGHTWKEIVTKFRDIGDEDEGDHQKDAIWEGHHVDHWVVKTWLTFPHGRPQRLVVGFPIVNESGDMVALGSIGCRNDELIKLQHGDLSVPYTTND